MDDEVTLVLTPMPRKPWKADKAVLQNGDAQEAKVAVAHRTNRTLATNIHGEASITLGAFTLPRFDTVDFEALYQYVSIGGRI